MRQLYRHKPLKCGFILLCHNYNSSKIKTTISSIRQNYPESSLCCVVSEACRLDAGKPCEIYESSADIASMLNVGIGNAPCDEWNFVISPGSWLRLGIDRKFSYFIDDDKDILFPVINRRTGFVEGSLNGFLIKKQAFQEIGAFDLGRKPEISKLFWTATAMSLGYKFKGIIGVSLS